MGLRDGAGEGLVVRVDDKFPALNLVLELSDEVDAGGGSGVNQHRDKQELVGDPQQAGGCPVHGSGRVPRME